MRRNPSALVARLSFLGCFVVVAATASFGQQLPLRWQYAPPAGSTFGDWTGRVREIGDVTGDGIPEIAFLMRDGVGLTFASRWQVVSGADGASFGVRATRYGGPVTGVFETVGDLDGDGLAEQVLVDRGASSPGGPIEPPSVHLVGGTGAIQWSTPVTTDPLATLDGGDVARLGDLDGDGVDELAVLLRSAFAFPSPGIAGDMPTRIVVLSGATGVLLHELIDDLRIVDAIAAVGDTDGDGVGDLGIVAPRSPFNGPITGGAAILSGATFQYLRFWNGTLNFERFGSGIAPAGDRDGDGLADVWISSQGTDSVTAYSGASGAAIETYPLLASADERGIQDGPALDWNGDGVPDHRFGLPIEGGKEIRSGVDFSLLANFFFTQVATRDTNGDGLPERATSALPGGPAASLETHMGAEAYGAGSAALGLSWSPVASQPRLGRVRVTGGSAFGSLLVAGSLAPADTIIAGTSLPLLIDPAQLFLQTTAVLDAFGELEVLVSLRQPAIAGSVLNYQVAELSPNLATSNGLQLQFAF
ncbi:MAG: VCBS repeat-containing protein [Planctomycetota bacterium]